MLFPINAVVKSVAKSLPSEFHVGKMTFMSIRVSWRKWSTLIIPCNKLLQLAGGDGLALGFFQHLAPINLRRNTDLHDDLADVLVTRSAV